MHITAIFDQTVHTGTNLLAYYDGSDDYNDYKSNYKSDNKEAPCTLISTIETPLVQLPNAKEQKNNVAYTLRQEKFNDNFSSKDLLNAI
ncbi:15823_t:CDS:2 [Cetraspora pellucida]|uniref:15823_t:CDS:1 n=1 Tax=Cetraspora pellucida TaxID=1433469 RepID=A0A9N8VGL4_9GLOM|nr:15823_t:CDS:2 [Cetraspora pellucida]